jgi:uncharacterized protein YjbI with pentapeptide repeats
MIDWKKVLLSDINDFNTRISNVPVLERNMFKGADLSNFDLSKAFIKSFDLSESDLTNAAVPGYLLSTCRLEKTILNNITYDDLYWKPTIENIQLIWQGHEVWNLYKVKDLPVLLNQTYFTNMVCDKYDFSDVMFTSANFQYSQFNTTILSSTIFSGSNMDFCIFKNIPLHDVTFNNTILKNTYWFECSLVNIRMVEADLQYSTFINCHFDYVSFNDSLSQSCVFEHCNFSNCSFFCTDLSNCHFLNCTFENANLSFGKTDYLVKS